MPIAPHPLLDLLWRDPHPDGDPRFYVIASVSGVRPCDRGELFDLLVSHVPHLRDRLSFHSDRSVTCEPALLPELAEVLAKAAVEEWGREVMAQGWRAA